MLCVGEINDMMINNVFVKIAKSNQMLHILYFYSDT